LERLAFEPPKALALWEQNPDVLLLDCTYKTNQFGMDLLNICAITGGNMVPRSTLLVQRNTSQESQGRFSFELPHMRSLQANQSIPNHARAMRVVVKISTLAINPTALHDYRNRKLPPGIETVLLMIVRRISK
jgi:hypothetical protein